MKKLMIIVMVFAAACSNQNDPGQPANEVASESAKPVTEQVNAGSKMKADPATKRTVAEMIQLVNDSSYANASHGPQLFAGLQTKIDTMVSQCTMRGPDHDALHVWLEKVLHDMKELEEDDEYGKAYAELKADIESFNASFE